LILPRASHIWSPSGASECGSKVIFELDGFRLVGIRNEIDVLRRKGLDRLGKRFRITITESRSNSTTVISASAEGLGTTPHGPEPSETEHYS
jgi:hypothetical protein